LDFETNALGSFNLLDAVRRHAPEAAVLYSSTNKVYGDLEQYAYRETASRFECLDRPAGFDETTPLDFHSPYGCTKGAADQIMLDNARIYGLRTVVFRHSSMYGGRQFATYDQGWVGWFCQKAAEAARGETSPFTISGTGKQVRDVLHAEDMVRLYFSALDQLDAAAGQAFNIGGGMANSLSLLELFSLLESLTGTQLRYDRLPPRESDQRVFVADIAKAERLLGWQPRVASAQGVAKMLEWVSQVG
jgi:CDP-paratose 2-epimerase